MRNIEQWNLHKYNDKWNNRFHYGRPGRVSESFFLQKMTPLWRWLNDLWERWEEETEKKNDFLRFRIPSRRKFHLFLMRENVVKASFYFASEDENKNVFHLKKWRSCDTSLFLRVMKKVSIFAYHYRHYRINKKMRRQGLKASVSVPQTRAANTLFKQFFLTTFSTWFFGFSILM